MDDTVIMLEDFIQSADDLATAFAVTGEDDNSSAARLWEEGKVVLRHLKTNRVSEPLAAAWLADAQKRLDDIG